MKKFIIIVDSQYDFMMDDGRLPVPGAEETIAPGIRFLASLSPTDTDGVLFTYDTHTEVSYIGSPENIGDEAAGAPGFPLHCEKGTVGWENVFNPAIIPAGIPVHTLEKNVFNMWEESNSHILQTNDDESTDFIDREAFFHHLRRRGVDTIIVIGVAADFCVKWAVEGLLSRGFNVEVPAHLTKGIVRQIEQVAAEDFPDATLTITE